MEELTYLEPYAKRPSKRFYMAGVGIGERMNPGIIHRPKGTWDWLFMFFHTPVTLIVNGVIKTYPEMTLMIWEEGQAHYYGHTSDPFQHSWIHCQGSVVKEAMKFSGLTSGVYPEHDFSPILQDYLPLIYQERVRLNIDMVIVENLFRCLLQDLSRLISPKTTTLPTQIHKIKHFLESHYTQTLRLDEICMAFSISKSHLINEFKRHLGIPPIDYLIQLRMEHARSLLLDRNLNVQDVAKRVGYDDIYHFSKLFKKHMGNTPSSFRP